MTTKATQAAFTGNSKTQLARLVSWFLVGSTFVFLINNFLQNIWDFPGAGIRSALSITQLVFYVAAFAFCAFYISKNPNVTLRTDSDRISAINTFLIRAAFWMVLLIGCVDFAISLLRVEGGLQVLFGESITSNLIKPKFRGLYVHVPLMFLSLALATVTKTVGFIWLALLVVIAELLIVFSRFIFSYEQAFMADLVRFWYGALFLFASAYTLLEEGHVRVDVFYAGFKDKTKGMVNAVGTILLGVTLCWTILIVGMSSKTSIINSPVFNFEVTQQGVGMYVKYLMAGFLGIFAISMMIQFASYFLAAIADYRGDPNKRLPNGQSAH